jgi:hypothetical protein
MFGLSKRLFSSSTTIRTYRNVFFQGTCTPFGSINTNNIDYFTITGWRDHKITFYKFSHKSNPVEILTVTFEDEIQAKKEYHNIINGNPPYSGF